MNVSICTLNFLPTTYVVRGKVMFWHVSVHPTVCPHLGGVPDQVQEGVPQPGPSGGYLCRGYPHLGYPPCQTWLGGTPPQVPLVGPGQWGGTPVGRYPTLGTLPPCQTWPGVPVLGGTHLRYPPSDLARGYPTSGTPPPLVRPGWGGGVPLLGWYPTSGGVLDTPWSVCLLRSRRRTFL